MRYLLNCLLILIFNILVAHAKELSAEAALNRYYTSENKGTRTRSAEKPELKLTVQSIKKENTIYVFNKNGNEGYIVLSADDNITPLLGYSDTGSFNAENLPPSLDYWLSELSNQIAYTRTEQDYSSTEDTISDLEEMSGWSFIPPMVTTKWNQDEPFNNLCTLYTEDGQDYKCVTGCVATAMAQVMNYYQYPEVAEGIIAYTIYSNVPPLEMNFEEYPFVWEEMLDSYSGSYTQSQADAVANLMKACGYSIYTRYGKNESSASSVNILKALTHYFKYSDYSRFLQREDYSSYYWKDIIYEHLVKYGPIIYNGRNKDEGHSFVCDGYDGNGYFHFNWGWGGISDGYFLLDALNPKEQGIGGSNGGYNLDQDIILAIPVSDNKPLAQVKQKGSLKGELFSGILELTLTNELETIGWSYSGTGVPNFNFGIKAEPVTINGEAQIIKTNRQNIEFSTPSSVVYGPLMNVMLSELDLVNGEIYKLTLVTQQTLPENQEWVPVLTSNYNTNYLLLSKEENGYIIHDDLIKDFKVIKLEPISEIYYNQSIEMWSEIDNPNKFSCEQEICLGFVDKSGKICYGVKLEPIRIMYQKKEMQKIKGNEWVNINGMPIVKTSEKYSMVLYNPITMEILDGIYDIVTLCPEDEIENGNVINPVCIEQKDDTIYSLSGVRIKDNNSLTRGIYIKNGKKIMIKK